MLDRKLIDAELARDPTKGRAEWLAEWRDDISTFIDRAMLEAAVDAGVEVRPREQGIRYVAFADPSGGAGDAFTLAIAHCTKDKVAVLDCLVEHPAPFNPVPVTESLVQTLAQYGLNECNGDHYAAGWVVGSFAARGVSYYNCPRDRSALYANVLPLFTSGAVRLLDNKKLVGQFAALERRPTTTRDKIDHPPAAHDDLCNAAAGALVLAAERSQEPALVSPIIVSAPRTYVGDANYIGGAGLAPHLDMYKRDWSVW
jgi:hypothetical protein